MIIETVIQPSYTHKLCSCCRKKQHLSRFYRTERVIGKRGLVRTVVSYKSRCKKCIARLNITDEVRQATNKLKRFNKYNITESDYHQLLNHQQYKCKTCGLPHHQNTNSKLYIDHDHSTNKVRGLLCFKCNTALGLVKDNTEILTNMITYLQTAA